MTPREFLGRYLRSPWGLATLCAAPAAFAAGQALGAGALGSGAAALGILALGLGFGLFTDPGRKAAFAELEREAAGRAASRAAAVREARSRLAALRLPEGEAARARDLLVLEAGRLDESFAATGACDPEAAQALREGLELLGAFLRERDEASTERRFALPDAHPFPRAEERTAAALREKAALVAARRAASAGELPPADAMAIDEELP